MSTKIIGTKSEAEILSSLASEADAYLRNGVPDRKPPGAYAFHELKAAWKIGKDKAHARLRALIVAGKIKPTSWLDTDAAGRPCRKSGYVVG